MLKILWILTSFLMVLSGLYFTKKLNFAQIRFLKMYKRIKQADKSKDGISSYNALMMTLAGRIGVGSLAGVALSIYLGGPGSIFWMVVMTFLSGANTLSETIVAIKYREKDNGNHYVGGPPYYIKNGLKKTFFSKAIAFLIIIVYIFGFLSIQANTITRSLTSMFPINPIIIGIVVGLLTIVIIYKGIDSIAKTTGKIVPIMGGLYLLFTFYIILSNITSIPYIINLILTSAFQPKGIASGILVSMIIGIQRSIFSNEAGLGTGTIAASTTSSKDPIAQGYIQVIGVYATTLIISLSTAIVILLSDYQTLSLIDVNGIELTQYAFVKFLGPIGQIIILFTIILFAFSTIIAGYYYGEASLKLIHNKKETIFSLKIITIIVLVFSSIIPAVYIWNLVDVLIAILGIVNIITVFKLRNKITQEYQKK